MTTKKWKENHFEKLANIMIEFLSTIKEDKSDEVYTKYTNEVIDLIKSI